MKVFLTRFYYGLVCIVLFLTIAMMGIKYKMYTLKMEIRNLENKIYSSSCNKDVLVTELNYLTSPERLMDIYLKLLEKNVIDEQFVLSSDKIKDARVVARYYAEKYKENKRTNVVSNGK